jgi:hypothetical protein
MTPHKRNRQGDCPQGRLLRHMLLSAMILMGLAINATAYYTMDLSSATANANTKDEMTVWLSLKNSGDEPAYNLRLELMLPDGFKAGTANKGILENGTTQAFELNVTLGEHVLPGSYSAPVNLQFEDVKGYMISMVYPLTLDAKGATTGNVAVKMEDAEIKLSQEKRLPITIANLDDTSHELTIGYAFPKTIIVKNIPKKINLEAKSTQTVEATVFPFDALPDSSFTYIISAAYESGGKHYETVKFGKIEIIKEGIDDSLTSNPLLLMAAALTVIIAIAYLRKNTRIAKGGNRPNTRKKMMHRSGK